ncbi:MAG: RecX family transcriptional regulator, partial [Fimbriimonadaceae bacterium]
TVAGSDARVARALIERSKGKGMERVAAELRRRGASEEVIASVEPVRSESDIAKHALAAKFGENFDPAKAWRFLRGRGFSEEVCEEVIPAHD